MADNKRYGVSRAELTIAALLDSLKIPYDKFRYVCFECGNIGIIRVKYDQYGNIISIEHPTHCHRCKNVFGKRPFEYCEPDFITYSAGKKNKFVVMVNGFHHTKHKFKYFKDPTQISFLKSFGLPVVVIETIDMEELFDDVARMLLHVYQNFNEIEFINNKFSINEFLK